MAIDRSKDVALKTGPDSSRRETVKDWFIPETIAFAEVFGHQQPRVETLVNPHLHTFPLQPSSVDPLSEPLRSGREPGGRGRFEREQATPTPEGLRRLLERLLAQRNRIMPERPVEALTSFLDVLAGRFSKPNLPERQLYLQTAAELTGRSEALLAERLDLALRCLRAPQVTRLLMRELRVPEALDCFVTDPVAELRTRAFGPALVGVMASSGTPDLALLAFARGLALKGAVVVRGSYAMAPEATLLFPLLFAHAESLDGVLSGCMAVVSNLESHPALEHILISSVDHMTHTQEPRGSLPLRRSSPTGRSQSSPFGIDPLAVSSLAPRPSTSGMAGSDARHVGPLAPIGINEETVMGTSPTDPTGMDVPGGFGLSSTLSTLTSGPLPGSLGSGLNIAVVLRAALREPENLRGLAFGIARDFALSEGDAGWAPRAVFVERGGTISPEVFARALSDAMAELNLTFPPLKLSPTRRAQLRSALSLKNVQTAMQEAVQVVSPATRLQGAVILEPFTHLDADRDERTIRVFPFKNRTELAQSLDSDPRPLKCVVMAGNGYAFEQLRVMLASRGCQLLCAPGQLYHPRLAWHRLGSPVLRPLLRWCDEDLSLSLEEVEALELEEDMMEAIDEEEALEEDIPASPRRPLETPASLRGSSSVETTSLHASFRSDPQIHAPSDPRIEDDWEDGGSRTIVLSIADLEQSLEKVRETRAQSQSDWRSSQPTFAPAPTSEPAPSPLASQPETLPVPLPVRKAIAIPVRHSQESIPRELLPPSNLIPEAQALSAPDVRITDRFSARVTDPLAERSTLATEVIGSTQPLASGHPSEGLASTHSDISANIDANIGANSDPGSSSSAVSGAHVGIGEVPANAFDKTEVRVTGPRSGESSMAAPMSVAEASVKAEQTAAVLPPPSPRTTFEPHSTLRPAAQPFVSPYDEEEDEPDSGTVVISGLDKLLESYDKEGKLPPNSPLRLAHMRGKSAASSTRGAEAGRPGARAEAPAADPPSAPTLPGPVPPGTQAFVLQTFSPPVPPAPTPQLTGNPGMPGVPSAQPVPPHPTAAHTSGVHPSAPRPRSTGSQVELPNKH